MRERLASSEPELTIELHEGCGRVKMRKIVALCDRRSFKAVVEFKSQTIRVDMTCRFCGAELQEGSGLSSLSQCGLRHVCAVCMPLGANCCLKVHPCGHPCDGLRDEEQCLPCLYGCPRESPALHLSQDREDECMMCYSGSLSEGPCVQLDCGHVFHFHCVRRLLEVGYPGPRIDFKFCQCPICR